MSFYPPSRIDPLVKNVPATQAVMRQASVAASRARSPASPITLFLSGARAEGMALLQWFDH